MIQSLHINKVVVLEGGKIVEMGDPNVLIHIKDGLYSKLAREQDIPPSSNDMNSKPVAYI